MKTSDAQVYCCPACRGALLLSRQEPALDGEVRSGLLSCRECQARYEIRDGIPRLVPSDNYAASFGYQWKVLSRTRVEAQYGRGSHARLDASSKGACRLPGQ